MSVINIPVAFHAGFGTYKMFPVSMGCQDLGIEIFRFLCSIFTMEHQSS